MLKETAREDDDGCEKCGRKGREKQKRWQTCSGKNQRNKNQVESKDNVNDSNGCI